MTNQYPAVIIGGPPHSGKSVLVHNLTRALRERKKAHYVLRATPDGEGDWSNEIDDDQAQALRRKGKFNPLFVSRLTSYLQNREFPLIVDVGGRPTPTQAALFRHCTYAILLIADRKDGPSAYETSRTDWHKMMAQQQVPVIADIRSDLHGESELVSTAVPLQGTQAGLERSQTIDGALFQALVDQLCNIFTWSEAEMAATILTHPPTELGINLDNLAGTLGSANGRFHPDQLPAIRDYLPDKKALALYGRAPNWIYATLGQLAYPAITYLFDARLGWVLSPTLPMLSPAQLAAATMQHGWKSELLHMPNYIRLELSTLSQFLDIDDANLLPLPQIPDPHQGVVVSGKLPNWLLVSIVRQLAITQPWVAVYQPQVKGAVVVASEDEKRPFGQLIPVNRDERTR